MANMTYCMMENTSRDLYDCLLELREHGSIEAWKKETDPSDYELEGLEGILSSCKEIIKEFDNEMEEE